MEQLTEKERQIVGFSLFTTSMKLGPSSFFIIESIIDKIGVRGEFEWNAKDWIEYADRKKKTAII